MMPANTGPPHAAEDAQAIPPERKGELQAKLPAENACQTAGWTRDTEAEAWKAKADRAPFPYATPVAADAPSAAAPGGSAPSHEPVAPPPPATADAQAISPERREELKAKLARCQAEERARRAQQAEASPASTEAAAPAPYIASPPTSATIAAALLQAVACSLSYLSQLAARSRRALTAPLPMDTFYLLETGNFGCATPDGRTAVATSLLGGLDRADLVPPADLARRAPSLSPGAFGIRSERGELSHRRPSSATAAPHAPSLEQPHGEYWCL